MTDSLHERAQQVVHLPKDTSFYPSEFQGIRKDLDGLSAKVTDGGMTGQMAEIIREGMKKHQTAVESLTARSEDRLRIFEQAKARMRQAEQEIQQLSPDLISPVERKVLLADDPSGALVQQVKEANRALRDAAYKRSLDSLSTDMTGLANELKEWRYTPPPTIAEPTDGTSGNKPYTTGTVTSDGGGDGRSHGTGTGGNGYTSGTGTSGSSTSGPVGTGPNGPQHPVTRPSQPPVWAPPAPKVRDPYNPKDNPGVEPIKIIAPDGTEKNYYPAPVTDRDDPRWHKDFDMGGVPSGSGDIASAGAAVVGVGGLAVGAAALRGGAGASGLGGAGMGAGGMGAAARLGGGAALAGGGMPGSGVGGGLSGSGAGAAAAAGRAGGTGAVPGSPMGPAGAASRAGTGVGSGGAAGGPGGMMGGGMGAAGSEKEERRRKKGYKAPKLEEEKEEPFESAFLFGIGKPLGYTEAKNELERERLRKLGYSQKEIDMKVPPKKD